MEIKDKDGKVIDRVLSLTKEGEKMLEELGYGKNFPTQVQSESQGVMALNKTKKKYFPG